MYDIHTLYVYNYDISYFLVSSSVSQTENRNLTFDELQEPSNF